MNISELLDGIAARPMMYLGDNSIFYLKAFLDGFVMGQEDNGQNSTFMVNFQKWIAERYSIDSSHSWARIIDFYSSHQTEAIDTALKLFMEFKDNYKF